MMKYDNIYNMYAYEVMMWNTLCVEKYVTL